MVFFHQLTNLWFSRPSYNWSPEFFIWWPFYNQYSPHPSPEKKIIVILLQRLFPYLTTYSWRLKKFQCYSCCVSLIFITTDLLWKTDIIFLTLALPTLSLFMECNRTIQCNLNNIIWDQLPYRGLTMFC